MTKKTRKRAVYSLLLMRDDSTVRSMRLKLGTLRFLIFLLFLLVVTAGLGGFAAYRYMDRFYSLQTDHKALEKSYIEARLELEQLTNVKSLVEQTEGGAIQAKNNEIAPETAKTPTAADKAASINATALQKNASLIVTQNKNGTTQNATLQNATSQKPTPFTEIALVDTEESPVRITDFFWKGAGAQRITIRYSLASVAGKQISGTVTYYGLHKNGTVTPLETRERADSRFAISRMKRMDATLVLPESLPMQDMTEIKALVKIEDGTSYQWTYKIGQ